MRDNGAIWKTLTENGHQPTEVIKFYKNFCLADDLALEAAKWSPCAREHVVWNLVNFKMGGRYAEITVPTMIVQGARDVVNPPELVRPIVAALPDCRLEILEDVNQFPPTEAPDKLDNLIHEFVEGLCV